MSWRVLFTGKTHTTNGSVGEGRSSDGFLDIKLPQPHPAAEDLFGVAWSACYMGAIEVAASRRIKLPAGLAVDAQIDLNLGEDGFFLTAHLNVSVPGLDREWRRNSSNRRTGYARIRRRCTGISRWKQIWCNSLPDEAR